MNDGLSHWVRGIQSVTWAYAYAIICEFHCTNSNSYITHQNNFESSHIHIRYKNKFQLNFICIRLVLFIMLRQINCPTYRTWLILLKGAAVLSSIKIGCFFSFIVGVYSKEKKSKRKIQTGERFASTRRSFFIFPFFFFFFVYISSTYRQDSGFFCQYHDSWFFL